MKHSTAPADAREIIKTMESVSRQMEQQLSPGGTTTSRRALREAARDEKAATLGYLSMTFGAITGDRRALGDVDRRVLGGLSAPAVARTAAVSS